MPPKRKARANGEGSLYQRSSDDMWVGSVTLPDGKRKPVYGKTQAKARAKLKELQAKIDAGLPITTGKGVTLAKWLTEEWVGRILPTRVKAEKISQNTMNSYADNVRLHIVPHIGHHEIGKLAPAHLRTWLEELAAKPSGRQKKPTKADPFPPVALLSGRAQAYAHTVLRIALNDAMREEIVTRNAVLLVDPPSGKSSRGRALTEEEVNAVFAAATEDRYATVWTTILGLGLRRGEALALRWSLLDLDQGLAEVGQSLQRVRDAAPGADGRRRGRLEVVKGKTEKSEATIPIPPVVVQALKDHRAAQEIERGDAEVWVDPDLVFTTGIGTPIEPRNLNRAWTALCERAGVKDARIHDLRHTAATWLYEEGMELKDIQHALRHSRLQTTSEVYTHFTKKTQARTATVMDGALKRLNLPGV
ncbi:tyrosine-type recombinase/integrase [Nocardiopsis sp. CA-288880]|uniref:tyrosine-type recombinase/integrase n=1 Tax=Nocardiopsis sp. CA-288880 TaxID=3239995 RepID=UPI003D982281